MAWLFVLVFAALLCGGLYRSGRLGRRAFELLIVAILFGAAGYAWQGSPSLPGVPTATPPRP
jgi:cytochrome c-type biogenesis protein CcmH